jgi:hypothetical protein
MDAPAPKSKESLGLITDHPARVSIACQTFVSGVSCLPSLYVDADELLRRQPGITPQMTSFDQRKDAFESKFAHDEELRFKATARRNKLLGLWAAEKLGKTGAEADAYAKSVVMADFEEAGDEDVVRKVVADLAAASPKLGDADVRKAMDGLMAQAIEQIQKGV